MLNAALLIVKDESAWLTTLDYLDGSLDNVATPDRIDNDTAALDSGVADAAKVYEAVGAVYFEEDGTTPVTIEPVAGSYTIYPDTTGSFSYRVKNDIVTIRMLYGATSAEAGITVLGLSDGKEDKEVCISERYSFYEKTLEIDFTSIATDYVASREGKHNQLETTSVIDPQTGESLKLSRRDAAILYCYFKAAAGDNPKWIITPLYDDVRILKTPPNLTPQAKVTAFNHN